MRKRALILVTALMAAAIVSLGFFWPFGQDKHQLIIPGTVEVQEIGLGSKVGGRVAEVFVREGDDVDANVELVRFAAPELEAQRLQLSHKLDIARLELKKATDGPRPQERAEAEAALRAAKARWDRIEAGWRKEERAQAENDLQAALADNEYAQKEFDRIEKINFQVSRTEYDAARTRWLTSQEKYNSAKARLDMLRSGSREEDKRELKAEYDRASARYELLMEGSRKEDIATAEAQLQELKAKLNEINASLDEIVVRSPSKIRIEVLGVRAGDIVAPNQPIIRALQAEDRWVRVFVPSTELGKIRRGDAVEVTCDSYPDRKFQGKIIQISNVSEFTPRNVQSLDERRHQVFGVKVRIEDGGDVFKAGMAAAVSFPLRESP